MILGGQIVKHRTEVVGQPRGDPFADPAEQTDHL